MPKENIGLGSYVDKIPSDVRHALDGLANELRQAIVVLLSEEDRLRFKDIQSRLSIPKSDLAFHLNRLIQTGLVSRFYAQLPSDESHAYYRLSDLGDSLLRGISDAFVPEVPIRTDVDKWAKFSKLVKPSWPVQRFERTRVPIRRLEDVDTFVHAKIALRHAVIVSYIGGTSHQEWVKN